ncbi:hypothetical protein Q4S45_15685 [Massilia sp. R2A-15]|uniref:hypothetical protein n=1 Tax=Massilia sp. R2A-15 TaxID=3064278 RepID=UPI0027375DC6|nr:hypothetical protein [Massilia sp. R2A-15]WLI88169.1 hypothetical protein Q4S45_15685 [Massilia sp. R2A-15]
MLPEELNEIDRLAHYYRSALWTALSVVVCMGAFAIALLGFPDTQAGGLARTIWPMLTIVCVIAVGGLQAAKKKADIDPMGNAVESMLGDELYKASLNRAYRNGFFGVLIAQFLLIAASVWIGFAQPVATTACATLVAGVAVTLLSLLFYDR